MCGEAASSSQQALGATIVNSSSPEGPTVILINPSSPHYSSAFEKAHSAPCVPYHWLAACKAAKARVDPKDLRPRSPIFVNEFNSAKKGDPLRTYVSVNIARTLNLDPKTNKAEMERRLACAGAIILKKRWNADLIILSKESEFFENVLEDKAKYQRTWQRYAEVDWVDSVLSGGELLSIPDGDASDAEEQLESQRSQREDSFAAEEVIDRVGPGRPTGK